MTCNPGVQDDLAAGAERGVGGVLMIWPPENGHHEVCYFDLVEDA